MRKISFSLSSAGRELVCLEALRQGLERTARLLWMEHLEKTERSMEGFPGSSAGKEAACKAGDPSSIPGLGRCTGEGIGYPLQYSGASPVAQLVKNPPAMWRAGFDPWVGKIPWRRERLPTPVLWPGEFHGLDGP